MRFLPRCHGYGSARRQSGPLHEQKQNCVVIYLDSGDMQIKYADGRVDNQHWKAGDIGWSPAGGMPASQNVFAQAPSASSSRIKKSGENCRETESGRRSRPFAGAGYRATVPKIFPMALDLAFLSK
jgi:hypothetical protein